jgi:Ca2+-binding RTX toxin-like protein
MQAVFSHDGTVFASSAGQLDGVRSLALHQGPDGVTVQVLSGEDVATRLTSWDLRGGAPIAEATSVLTAGPVAGVAPDITPAVLPPGQEVALLTGVAGGLAMVRINADGSFGAPVAINAAAAGVPADLSDIAVMDSGEGLFLYGIAPGSRSPMVWEIGPTGTLTVLSSGSRGSADGPGLTDIEIANGMLVAAGSDATFLTIYDIQPDGRLSMAAQLGEADNPGIAGSITLETLQIGETSFAVLGAAGSGTLTVYGLESGRPRLTDHVIDTRDSRFANVTTLDSAVLQNEAFLAAAGSDDGVSLFRLTADGQLVHLGVVADSVSTAVSGVSDLALYIEGGSLHLVTLGVADQGLSAFSIALSGISHMDETGADTMIGQAGADLFVMIADADPDRIVAFDASEDRLDLSGWAFYRNPSQLSISPTASGAEIRFMSLVGEEVLVLESAGGGPLSADAVIAAILPQPDRFLPDWLTPVLTLEPADPPQDLAGTPGNDSIEGGSGNDTIIGRGGSDLISAGAGNDTINAGIGADTIFGGAGADTVTALDGHDWIEGGDGDDHLSGNAGFDTIFGDAADDHILGGNAPDLLNGGSGNDRISGDDGADTLHGGEGDDILTGNAGTDLVMGESGSDTIWGGINHDTLDGGEGRDFLYGEGGNDVLLGSGDADELWGGGGQDDLSGGGGDDTLDGGLGHDTLQGDAGNDRLIGKNGSDILDGGAGDDTLFGGSGNDTLSGGGGNDILDGGDGADVFIFAEGVAVVTAFQNDVDMLLLDPALWGGAAYDAAAMLSFAEAVDGATVFTFPGGERLVIEGLVNPDALLNDIGLL